MTPRFDCEVIIVGAELLKGERTDAHLGYMGRALGRCGVRITRAHVVGDVIDDIATSVSDCVGRSRVVIVTGGLGPTDDDITRDGVAKGLGLELEFHEPSWEVIEAFFTSRGVDPSDTNKRQAHFPTGADVIENALGTAPGFAVPNGDGCVFVLPGPPHELQPMFESAVLPRVQEMFGRRPLRVETFRTIGIGESQLMQLLGDAMTSFRGYDLSSLPSMTGVDLILTGKTDADAELLDNEANNFEKVLRKSIGHKLYEHGERSLAGVVGALLVERNETVAIAESLTGGLIGTMITDVAGASAYFLAGPVTYSDASKIEFLGVRAETLATHGAVSEEVCIEMAHGARNRGDATWGVATTGIAGPSGGTARKPVGLTFIGVAFDGGTHVKRIVYRGGRDIVRERAARGALWILYDQIMARQ